MRTRILFGTLACFSFWAACGGTGATGLDNASTATGGSGTTKGGAAGAAGKAGASTGKGGSGVAAGGSAAAGKGATGGSLGNAGTAGASAGGASAAGASAGGSGGSAGGLSCAANTADCNGNPADKCEIHTDLDPNNCGACGKKCSAGTNQVATCTASQCGAQCQAGFTDCDKNAANGCEAATGADTSNCGTCGNVCPTGGGAKASCAGGACFLSCSNGTGDCNNKASDGCEANFATDPKNCGACGMDCGGGSCVSGACQCAGETQTAQKIPLDMFIMMDQSGSMNDATASGATKWDAVKQAFAGFVADPKETGLGVGIGFFGVPAGGGGPPSSCSTNQDCIVGGTDYGPCIGAFPPILPGICLGGGGGGDSCAAADYAKPYVEIAPLPGVGAMINSAMNAHSPTTSTPTAPALEGALIHAKAWAMAHPDHVVIAVLATDGDPTECSPTDIPSIAAIAAGYLNGTPKIRTFVIGVGSSTANLDGIAMGGGTAPAFVVDTNANVVQQFEDALAKIQGTALGCQYVIPKPATGTLDYTKVNVQYTPGNGGSPVIIGNVANAAACDAIKGGWYYDNPNAPTQILLCDATCKTVSSDTKGTISVQLGCATKKV